MRTITSITLSVLLFVFMLTTSSCYVGRTIIWNFGDYDDYKKFDQATIPKGATTSTFYPSATTLQLKTPAIQAFIGKQSLNDFFENTKSTSFIVIRKDSLLYENYFNGHKREALHCINSVSKSFLSLLVGIALQEGKIKSIQEPITTYIQDLANSPFDSVTIEDVLYMRSGLDYSEAYYSPFGDLAKFYYGTNMRKYLKKMTFDKPIGEQFDYVSANTDLLGWLLEEATGEAIPAYLSKKVWQPLEMEFEGTWSLDSKKNGVPKYSYGLNTRAIDLAKLGQLYLNQGQYKKETIINKAWVQQSTTADSVKRPLTYQNHWWHEVDYKNETDVVPPIYDQYAYTTKSGEAKKGYILPTGNYYAAGFLGQFVYVYPQKNIIIIRTGKRQGKTNWIKFFRAIAEGN